MCRRRPIIENFKQEVDWEAGKVTGEVGCWRAGWPGRTVPRYFEKWRYHCPSGRSRGYRCHRIACGTAEMIKKSGIRTPVIEIPITGPDIAQALIEAKRITGLENPKIAVHAFDNMMYDIGLISKLLNLDLLVYWLGSGDDIPAALKKTEIDKVDIIIGGITTTRLAAERGLNTLLLSSGESALRSAFMEAKKVADARALEKEKNTAVSDACGLLDGRNHRRGPKAYHPGVQSSCGAYFGKVGQQCHWLRSLLHFARPLC